MAHIFRKRMALLQAGLLIIAAVLGFVVIGSATSATQTDVMLTPTLIGGGSGQIVYTSNRDGNAEIYIMDIASSITHRLTNDPAHETFPAWSPDGEQIAFKSSMYEFAYGFGDLFMMNADGSNVRNLTNNPPDSSMYYRSPTWSPDGTRIAFVSNQGSNEEDVFVINVDGEGLHRVSTIDDPRTRSSKPAWSPDGEHIAFNAGSDDNYHIYVADVDGSNLRRLDVTDNLAPRNVEPAWSPDGRQIAFCRGSHSDLQIYMMDADGSNVRRLTNNLNSACAPTWSPQGKEIAFTARLNDHFEIYMMDADGNNIRPLTNYQGDEYVADKFDPAWSPDGKQISFGFALGFTSQIYAIDLESLTVRRLTFDERSNLYPSWRP